MKDQNHAPQSPVPRDQRGVERWLDEQHGFDGTDEQLRGMAAIVLEYGRALEPRAVPPVPAVERLLARLDETGASGLPGLAQWVEDAREALTQPPSQHDDDTPGEP